ncbi:MAG: ATP-grasp domain-containing protein [Gammaproteobacteria bacterium]|nr:ATP-grasp domain-containing protein [Gammaproteobacteria bacterium]
MTLFTKILIANRGEIACRIMRTANKLAIKTVAVFSEPDSDALHVKMADEAYLLGGPASKDSYLNIDKIIAIAKKTNAQAIHPGYGFLSENSAFAKACEDANIVFIGPHSAAINLMANKNIAKEVMNQHGVPTLPGYYDDNQSLEGLKNAASEMGYPVLLKAVAGGGGKGLRLVDNIDEFEPAYHAVRREAKAFFNDEKVLIEKYLANARHVEVQVLADKHGTVQTLMTRDCSIQRRHQKIIEEAPAPNISPELEEKMLTAAVTAAKAIQYTNAGTIEFLLQDDAFYFMEMNTRLQVEHPVTEMISGIDIVEWQLRIAAGEKLFATATIKGHAIEARLNAEDPQNNFLPSSGALHYFKFPTDFSQLRIDSGYAQGDIVNIYYDSLLAKLIVWSENRKLAIRYLQAVLDDTFIFGIKTNIPLLKNIFKNKKFIESNFNTQFLQQEDFSLQSTIPSEVVAIASLFLMQHTIEQNVTKTMSNDSNSPWNIHNGWQLYFPPCLTFHFADHLTARVIQEKNKFIIQTDDQNLECNLVKFSAITETVYELIMVVSDQLWQAKIFCQGAKIEIITQGEYYFLARQEATIEEVTHEHEEQLLAPMPGTIVALLVNSGQKVTKGDKLIVIEAMKMEHTLYAPRDGIVKQCYFKMGDLIKEGSELIEFEA